MQNVPNTFRQQLLLVPRRGRRQDGPGPSLTRQGSWPVSVTVAVHNVTVLLDVRQRLAIVCQLLVFIQVVDAFFLMMSLTETGKKSVT